MTEGPAAVQFSDENVDAISCESTWRQGGSRETDSISCQTNDLETFDVGSMSVETYEAASQTRPVHQQSDTDQHSEEFLHAIKRAADLMLNELSQTRSKAFDNYQVMWEDELDCVSCLLTMNEPETEKCVEMPVTGLSWNCTGSVLAASFGHTDHPDWCHHKARVSMWNIDRHDKVAKRVDNLIDVDSCVMCLEYHPNMPGVLAAGTFTGDVIMWDLAREAESSVLMSDSQQDSHGDTVCQVHWLVENRKSSLISITTSGCVNIWIVAQKGAGLALQKSHAIQSSHNFKLRLKANSVGSSVVAFDPADNGTFLLGTETGGVFKCRRDTDQVNALLSFRAHNGPVYGLQFSKLNRNIFMTCGTDCCINLYTTLQDVPLVSLEPCQGYLYSCRWSPTVSSVLAAGGSAGQIVFYNLSYSHLTPYHTLVCCEERIPIHAVEFNAKHTNLIASGDARGVVKVWTLGGDLSSSGSESQDLPAVLRDAMSSDG